MSRLRREAGFTLVELLAATVVSVVVAVAAYAALTGGLSVYERAGDSALRTQVVRALAGRITRELQGVYFNPEAPDTVFTGTEADEADDTPGPELTFVTTAGEGPLMEISYLLREPDPEAGEPGGLFRRARPLLDRQVTEVRYETDSSEEAEALLLASEVVGFDAAYYDPQAVGASEGLGLRRSLTGQDEWETSWDADTKGYLPHAVRLTFRLGSWETQAGSNVEASSSDGRTYGTGEGAPGRSFTVVVALPLAESAIAEELGSGGGEE